MSGALASVHPRTEATAVRANAAGAALLRHHMLELPESASLRPFVVRGVLAVAIALLFAVAGMAGWVANQSWWLLLPVALLVCLEPFQVLWNESTCENENCQQTLRWREALTRASLCEICRQFLLPPTAALPQPDETADPRERARREFRCRAAEALRDPRVLDDEQVATLTTSREAAGLPVRSASSEPARMFWTYAAQLRALPDFSPNDLDRLFPAVVAMTGRPHDSLDDPRWFERVGTLALIRAADADWLRAEGDAGGVLLKPEEEKIWIEHVSLLKPAEVRLKEVVSASVSVEIGATVSAKATLEKTTQLPPGELTPIGEATIVVTDRRTMIIGHEQLIPKHEEIVGLSAPWARVCRINHTQDREAAYVRCRSGLLLCAAINCGIRTSVGRALR